MSEMPWIGKQSSDLTEKERIKRVLRSMEGVYDISKYQCQDASRKDQVSKRVFQFFDSNQKKSTSLGEILWSDYTRFPRTYEGALLALEVFIEDLVNELEDLE